MIVATLDEENHLPAFLQNMEAMMARPLEVIVSDAGSGDRTAAIARQHGAQVVHASRGRGPQFCAGIDRAKGDVLFFAHADMTLESDAFSRMLEVLNATGAAGGCIGCRFDRPGLFLRFISRLNNLRAKWLGLSFGDQGQFVRRDRLNQLGGFPDLMIMEDVEFSLRLKAMGKPLFLGGGIIASTRRWNRVSKSRHALLIIWLVAQYTWLRYRHGAPVNVEPFYQRYYGRAGPRKDAGAVAEAADAWRYRP